MNDPELRIAVEQHPAYWVLTAAPDADHSGVVVSLRQLRQTPERFLGPLATGVAHEEVYDQILDLVASSPGVPLGLTFDGGIAVTHTDYRLAVRRWEESR